MRKYTYMIDCEYSLNEGGGAGRFFIVVNEPINNDFSMRQAYKHLPNSDKFTGFSLRSVSLMDIQEGPK